MLKLADLFILAVLGIIVYSIMLLSGCTSDSGPSTENFQPSTGDSSEQGVDSQADFGTGPGQQYAGPRTNMTNGSGPGRVPGAAPPGGFGNRSDDAQRQEFLQQGIRACEGKAEGDTCAMQSQRGNMTGTCKAFNEALSCLSEMGGTGGSRGNLPGGGEQPE